MSEHIPIPNIDTSYPESEQQTAESSSPVAPKIKTSELPDVDHPPPYLFTEPRPDDEFASLPPSNLFDMNQDAVPERPLIAPLVPMVALREEYEGGSRSFVKQIDWLMKQGYIGIRRTRGDGDCFYRSLGFSFIERLLNAHEPALAVTTAMSVLELTQPLLDQTGFQRLVYEDFYDILVELIRRIIEPGPDGQLLNSTSLLQAFNDPEVSNSIVVYLRFVTSAQMKSDRESYEAFLSHPETTEPMGIEEFCENFVEAGGKEADHVQITALCRALRVNVSVAYLDGHNEDGQVDFHEFQNTSDLDTDPVILLYRPGHYDILDRRGDEPVLLGI